MLAVRCKYCGIRLSPPTGIPEVTGLEAPTEQRVSAPPPARGMAGPPSVSDRVSAPPPASPRRSTPPPPAGSSVPPAAFTSLPKPSVPPPPAGPPSNEDLEDDPTPIETSLPDASESGVPAPPTPSAPPPAPEPAPPAPVPAVTPSAPPAVISAPPPPPPAAPLAAPGAKRTMLGMAPVQLPQTGPEAPAAEAVPPAEIGGPTGHVPSDRGDFASSADTGAAAPQDAMEVDNDILESTLSDLDDTPMPSPLDVPAAMAAADYNSAIQDVNGDALDDLDLGDELLEDDLDLDEISQFEQQTAITDVSNLAASTVETEDVEGTDLPGELLDEIASLPSVGLDDQMADEMPSLRPVQPEPAPVRAGGPPRSGGSHGLMVGIVVGVVVAIGAVVFVLMGGLENATDSETGTEVAAIDKPEAEPAPTPDATQTPDKEKSIQELLGNKNPELKKEQNKGPSHTCKPFKDYPQIPWSDKLGKVVQSVDADSICGLFGLAPEAVTAGLSGEASFGPTGYDLLPKGGVFELFPMGKAKRRAPSIEFVFSNDQLIEIHFNYKMEAADKLNTDLFKPLLGSPKMDKKDPLDRQVARYEDDDLLIIHYEKTDAYQRKFNHIIFRSAPLALTLKEELEQREKAVESFDRGMAYFTQKQTKRAIDQFHNAVKTVPSMGIAYIFEGITWLQVEEFEKAAKAADKAVENSVDDRAKAGAHGLHAVIALYSGDTMSAELLFRKAAELDPTDPEFTTSAEELSSGKYAPDRVAKTAARMSCLKKNRTWSQKGLLARGNFPDNKTYLRAYKKVKRKAEYKKAYDMWVGWECQ